jgi:hypothetical protein
MKGKLGKGIKGKGKASRGGMKGGNMPSRITRGSIKQTSASCPQGSWCFNQNTILYIIIGILLVALVYVFWKSEFCQNLKYKLFSQNAEVTNVYNQYHTSPSQQAEIYPPEGTHTANYENPFAPPLKPNQYFMPNKKMMDIRSMNVNIDGVHTSSQAGNPGGIILKDHETHHQGGVPINVKTSYRDVNFAQVGILTRGDNGDTILPLFGRPLSTNRNKWQYYTMNDKFQTIKLPIKHKNMPCSNDRGCDEVFNNDVVHVDGYNQTFTANVYETNTPSYIPYV